jgi:hypothetical protein
MTKILMSLAALAIIGAAALPVQANAAERKPGISKEVGQPTDVSARRRHYRHRYYAHRHWGPRRYWGPRYGYYGYPYPYHYRPYYYAPAPFVSFGLGPFGFRVF